MTWKANCQWHGVNKIQKSRLTNTQLVMKHCSHFVESFYRTRDKIKQVEKLIAPLENSPQQQHT